MSGANRTVLDSPQPPNASAADRATDGGVGWYRLKLDLPADVRSRSVLLRFGAVYMNAEIWVNGQSVGRHAYGYTPFTLDISHAVRPGPNLIAVRVDNEQPSSRWYSGSGILRRVYVDLLDKLHIDPRGPTITTPDVTADKAAVRTATIGCRPLAERAISKI